MHICRIKRYKFLQCAQVHQADTFSRQLGWVFVGPCHPSVHGPPAKKKKQFNGIPVITRGTHTHTPSRAHRKTRCSTWVQDVQIRCPGASRGALAPCGALPAATRRLPGALANAEAAAGAAQVNVAGAFDGALGSEVGANARPLVRWIQFQQRRQVHNCLDVKSFGQN